MATTKKAILPRLGGICRVSAVSVIAGICRWMSMKDINDRIAARPVWEQAAITVGVLSVMFALCLIAAQFGWIGMLSFFLAIIVIVN